MAQNISAGGASVEVRLRDRTVQGLKALDARINKSVGRINRLSASMKSIGSGMQSMGRRLAGVGAGMAAPLAIAAKVFSDFEDGMLSVGAVSGATSRELLALTKTAERLGRETAFTASSVSGLQLSLSRLGFRPSQVDKMTESVLALSSATATEPDMAASILGSVMRQFRLPASAASVVADQLTAVTNRSATTLESVGESLSYVGTVASDANISLAETLSLVGGLGNVSVSGSAAGTALRRIALELSSSEESIRKAFGVETRNAVGDLRPINKILSEIISSMRNLGAAERSAKLESAFGLLGVNAASSIGGMTDSIDELQRGLESSGGTAKRVAEQMQSGLGGAFRKLQSAAEGVAIAVGKIIGPEVQKATDVIASKLVRVSEVLSANPEIVKSYALLTAGILGLGVALAGIGGLLATVGTGLAVVATAIASTVTAIGGGLSTLGAVAFFAPIQFQLAALVALTGAAVVVWGRLDTVVRDTLTGIRVAMTDVSQDFVGAFDRISQAMKQGGIRNAWKQITNEMTYLGEVMSVRLEIIFQSMINSVLGKLQSLVAGVGDVIRFVAGKLPKAIRNKVASVADDADFNMSWRIAGGEAKLERLVRELAELRDNPPEISITFDGDKIKSFASIISDLGRAIYDDFRSKNAKQQQGGGPVGAAPTDKTKPKRKSFVLESLEAERDPFGFSPSFASDYELRDLSDDIIDRLDKGLMILNLPKPVVEEAPKGNMRDRMAEVAGLIAGPLGKLGNAVGGALGGALPSGLRPTSGPARLDILPTGAAMPSVPSRPTAPMMPSINRPDTGTPMSGLGAVERHMRRFFHMADAMAGAVSWFEQPKPPTMQPAFDDSPKIANAIDDLGSGISSVLSNAVASAKNWIGIDGARAKGGPVRRGGTYIVGERGPELFMPSQSGEILPNDKLDGAYADGSRGALAAFEEKMSAQLNSAMAGIIADIKPAPDAAKVQRHLDAVSEFGGGKGGPTFRRAEGSAMSQYERRLSDMQSRGVGADVIQKYQAKYGPGATDQRKQRMGQFDRRIQDMQSRGVDPSIIENYKQRYGSATQMAAATAVAQRPTFQPAPGPDVNNVMGKVATNTQNALKSGESDNKNLAQESTAKEQLKVLDEIRSKLRGFGNYT